MVCTKLYVKGMRKHESEKKETLNPGVLVVDTL